jgi:hypothetical protein
VVGVLMKRGGGEGGIIDEQEQEHYRETMQKDF